MPGTPRVLIHVWCISHGFLKRGRRSRDTEWWQRLAAEKARDKDGVGSVRSLFYNSEGTAASSCHVTHRAQQEGPGLASPCPAGVCPPPVPPLDDHKGCLQGWSHGINHSCRSTSSRVRGLARRSSALGGWGTTSRAPKGRAGSQGRRVCAQEAVGGEEVMGGLGRGGERRPPVAPAAGPPWCDVC